MSREVIWQVTTPAGVCGGVLVDGAGIIVYSAPYFRFLIGQELETVKRNNPTWIWEEA